MAAQGDRAVVLFTVQRTDCNAFAACHELDPAFAQALSDVSERGVEVLAYGCTISLSGVTLAGRLPWRDAPRGAA